MTVSKYLINIGFSYCVYFYRLLLLFGYERVRKIVNCSRVCNVCKYFLGIYIVRLGVIVDLVMKLVRSLFLNCYMKETLCLLKRKNIDRR